jgi:zeaxanthin glucosyltransferase
VPRHFGLFCIQGTGHLYPIAALGRTLLARGHRVSCFQDVKARAIVKTAGLDWRELGTRKHAIKAVPAGGDLATTEGEGPSTRDLMWRHAEAVLAEGCAAVERAGVDAVVVDQGDLATGTVAERLGLPYITVSFFPPVYLDSEVPPNIVGWSPRRDAVGRVRNWAANRALSHALAPILAIVNEQRRAWGLRELGGLNDVFSRRAMIAQLPECLDFPRRRKPPQLHHAGPFQDNRGRYAVEFPWDALNGRPLVYASMGTVRNKLRPVFTHIAAACAALPVQLVIALGGGLDPDTIGPLPGQPIVVHYAPQLELMRRAAVTITHGGLNTTLESLSNGVPLVALPVTDDQPGVGARIKRAGVGRVIPARTVTTASLHEALADVMTDPRYRQAARRIRDEIGTLNGPERAVSIIEDVS